MVLITIFPRSVPCARGRKAPEGMRGGDLGRRGPDLSDARARPAQGTDACPAPGNNMPWLAPARAGTDRITVMWRT